MFNDERVYKDYVSQTFNRVAPGYDRVGPRLFSHFGSRLVELAGVCQGASVLDVGCGRGAILFPAAEKSGTAGEVVGIDIADLMVQRTAIDIDNLGFKNASVRCMDAEALQFPQAWFDFVLCGFGLYEFYDLDLALAEAFRVLKPGGVFASSIWGANVDKRWDCFRTIIKKYQGKLRPAPEAINLPRLRESKEIESVLSKAGFVHLKTVAEEKEFYFRDVDEWWAFEWSHGNRFLWERMAQPVLDRCQRELFEAIGRMKGESGIPIKFQILLTRAEKPYS